MNSTHDYSLFGIDIDIDNGKYRISVLEYHGTRIHQTTVHLEYPGNAQGSLRVAPLDPDVDERLGDAAHAMCTA